ncbi:MAG TPA: LAGLIDADG family homing endonuclease [Kofleriaceae bacterium]|nr:LAGLIDADG family homing endonuclease [Kofleriaceae bacterium]
MDTFSHETLEPHWVTGFVDGEGSFTYSRSSAQLALYFAIKLTEIERPLLEAIQDYFGVGKIYSVRASAPKGHGGATKTAAYYRVTHRDHLMRVVEHFDAYPLRSYKRNVYEVWRLMVLAKQQFRKPDRELMESLAGRITDLSARKQA